MKPTINLTNVYGTKSITLDQYPPEAWDFLEGDADGIDVASIRMLAEAVPWLFRGLNILVQAVASVPMCLTKGKKDAGYLGGEIQSPFPFVDDLPVLVRRISASLILEGRGYLFRDQAKTVQATKKLWYWNPLSVTFDAKKTEANKIISFIRKHGSVKEDYTSKEVIYFWPEDVYVEIGPPTSSPAKAALSAAGVLYGVDQYVSAYFKRGAIKAMMLAVKGTPSADQKTELQKWWKDITGGVRKAFSVFAINADSVTPTVIGDGLEGLQDSSLTQEKREDISTALGIPQTILFSTGAGGIGGGGVMSEDTQRFYQQTVVPLARFICDTLNQQQFKGLDYRLDVREKEMPLFQEDEGARAEALGSLVTALADPEKFLLAASIQGYDLSEEAKKQIEALIAKKEDNARILQEQMNPKPEIPSSSDTTPPDMSAPAKEDMARLRRKALKNIGKEFSFESDCIPNLSAIMAQLKTCKTEAEVKTVFETSETVSPVPIFEAPDFTKLMEAMQVEVQMIKSVPAQPWNITVNNHPGEPPVVNVAAAEFKAEAPVVNVNVEPTPIQNNVQVSPTPVTVENTVNVPENVPDVVVQARKARKVKVTRDKNGQIDGMEEK